MMANPSPIPRAPAVRAKLDQAEEVLADLTAALASLALEASEGKRDAEKALAAHRIKIEAAERQVSELRGALVLAERLDREAAAAAGAVMHAEQFTAFKAAMLAREKAMGAVLEAAKTMAAAYGRYSEATLAAQIAAPSGTAIPQMAIGTDGLAGPTFGPCERLILAELYRLAPERGDGAGRFVLPFAKPTNVFYPDPTAIPPALSEFIKADQIIIDHIEKQIAALDQHAMATAAEAA
jgi:hypothetical protein